MFFQCPLQSQDSSPCPVLCRDVTGCILRKNLALLVVKWPLSTVLVPVIVVVLTKGEKQRLLFSPAALSSHSTWPHLSFGPMLMIIFKDNRVIIIRKRIGDWGGGWHSAKAPKIMQMFSSPAEPCYPSRKQKICCSLGYSGITSSALSPSSALFDSTDWLCWLCTSIQGLLPYSWVHSFVLFP